MIIYLIAVIKFSWFGTKLASRLTRISIFWVALIQAFGSLIAITPFFIVSYIAASAWLFWKTRYDLIFRNVQPRFETITSKAFAHINEFYTGSRNLHGKKKLILKNFSWTDEDLLFV